MQTEIWKDLPEYEGLYQVSTIGRVRSLPRDIYYPPSATRGIYKARAKGRILKTSVSNGYYQIVLRKNNKRISFKIHQLVAITFLGHKRCGYKWVIDHKDNNPKNNNLDNLHIVTQRFNSAKHSKKCTSKYTGVSWNKIDKKWISRIMIEKIGYRLGSFKTEIEASNAYQNKLKEISI